MRNSHVSSGFTDPHVKRILEDQAVRLLGFAQAMWQRAASVTRWVTQRVSRSLRLPRDCTASPSRAIAGVRSPPLLLKITAPEKPIQDSL